MPTLISFHTSGGQKGRCDSRCYNATLPDCKCICGGMNHGVSFEVAVKNTQEYAGNLIWKASADRGVDVESFKVHTQK